MKKLYLLITFLLIINFAGCREKNNPTNDNNEWNTYETEKYTLQYPSKYSIEPSEPNGNYMSAVTTIYKSDINGPRLELFTLKNFGADRPLGFTGEETDKDIFVRETKSLGNGEADERLHIWFYYTEVDKDTKKILQSIANTIKLK